MNRKVFGKIPSGARLQRIETSPNYKRGSFQNIEYTEVTLKNVSFSKMLRDYFNKPKSASPSQEIPSVTTNLHTLVCDDPTFIWFGHSSYFLKLKEFTLLIDPVFSGYASPFSIFGKSFPGTDVYTVADFPFIDLLVITHDHYDHLDYKTILQLKDKVKKIVAPLGVGEHLEYWGVDSKKIVELDWWQSEVVAKETEIIATPARHFSGRGLKRGKSLWASYVLLLHNFRIFLGGDSGYDEQFKAIGRKYGPFDLAILESGQYGENWPYIHMLPEETVQAAKHLNAAILLPVHWGKFVLANHRWNEPIERIVTAAKKAQLKIHIPKIGEPYVLGGHTNENTWWLSE